jgi:hypothetical protein
MIGKPQILTRKKRINHSIRNLLPRNQPAALPMNSRKLNPMTIKYHRPLRHLRYITKVKFKRKIKVEQREGNKN